jgi:hypothetical protein
VHRDEDSSVQHENTVVSIPVEPYYSYLDLAIDVKLERYTVPPPPLSPHLYLCPCLWLELKLELELRF